MIDWVVLRDRVSFTHTAEILRRELTGEIEDEVKLDLASSNKALLFQVLAIDRQSLANYAKAKTYMAQRGLDLERLILAERDCDIAQSI